MALETDLVDVLGAPGIGRLKSELESALKRRPAQEPRLAGALRVLVPLSVELQKAASSALSTMIRRGSFERPLYAALVRALAECADAGVEQLLAKGLAGDDHGGMATLSAACSGRTPALAEPLARAASSRHAHLAFAAEIARSCRGESSGAAVTSLAPKIKESHRITLCVELLVPLLRRAALPASVIPALAVLRDAERHLGRWLVLAELSTRAGDTACLAEARERAQTGPESARSAWALLAWALAPESEPPAVRPTVELVARLSDRPSADKDTSFLFRLADARVPSARPMLESLSKGAMLGDECAVRALLHLGRDYGWERASEQLTRSTNAPRKDPVRALALAALFDLGKHEQSLSGARELLASRNVSALGWSLLLLSAGRRERSQPVLNELNFRRINLAWVE